MKDIANESPKSRPGRIMKTAKKTPAKRNLDLEKMGILLNQAKTLAKEYRELTGRPLGITGEIAEYEAARLLNLALSEVRQAGYDAIRSDGKRLQIKGRVILDPSKLNQRIGSIRLDHDWDAVLLVILDKDFAPVEIYEAQRTDVDVELKSPGSRARNVRGALGVRKFKSIARLVWSRDVNKGIVEVGSGC
jgi:hypothetical protein